jgi:hypothetical protein
MEGDVAAFSTELETLKQHGVSLLVLSDPGSSPAICDHLLGDDTEVRRRLFVSAGRGDTPGDRSAPDSSRLGVVEVTGDPTRSSSDAVARPTPNETGRDPTADLPIPDRPGPVGPDESAAWYSRLTTLEDLPGLARHVNRHLRRFEAADPDPSEIRLCFDSLDPFVDTVDQRDLFRFLHVVTNRLRAADAMAHFHLSAAADAVTVRTLRPLFDATVEVRATVDGPQQRWTLRDAGLRTDWLPLDDD